jgi:hypothetical protein
MHSSGGLKKLAGATESATIFTRQHAETNKQRPSRLPDIQRTAVFSVAIRKLPSASQYSSK